MRFICHPFVIAAEARARECSEEILSCSFVLFKRVGDLEHKNTNRKPQPARKIPLTWGTMWMAVAITALIFAIGNIYFGHFEERKPQWKRAMKIAIVTGAVALLSSAFGALWGLVPIALMLIAAVIIHGWWLPRHGITGEPKEKYYELIEARRRKRS